LEIVRIIAAGSGYCNLPNMFPVPETVSAVISASVTAIGHRSWIGGVAA